MASHRRAVFSGRNALADINLTPLVDVALTLLVVFMIAAPMIQQGVEVNLPKVNAQQLPAESDLLVITIDRSGSVTVGKTRVSVETLGEKLKAIYERKENKQAFIRADNDVPYGVVVRVMAETRKAGIEHLGMVTELEIE